MGPAMLGGRHGHVQVAQTITEDAEPVGGSSTEGTWHPDRGLDHNEEPPVPQPPAWRTRVYWAWQRPGIGK